MKSRKGFVPEDGVYPLQGINAQDPSSLEDPKFSPYANNVTFDKGVMSRRAGYNQLGSQIQVGGVNVTDPVMLLVEFEDSNGVIYLVACTTKRQYFFSSGTWTDITQGVNASTPVEFTGSIDNRIDYCVGTCSAGRWLIITNGKDAPVYFDGSLGSPIEFKPLGINLVSFVTCQTVTIFQDRLIIGNVTVSDKEPQLIAWSEPGDFENFIGGTSGSILLTTSQGAILKLLPLGDRIVSYSENSIDILTYAGYPILFSSETLVQNTRLLSGGSIVNLGPFHLYANQENIYLFEGNRLVRPVGDFIRPLYRRDVYLAKPNRGFAFLDNIQNQVYFVIPASETENICYKLEYDLNNTAKMVWSRESYRNRPISLGYLRRDETLTWISTTDYSNTWDDEAGIWYDNSLRQSFPVRVFGGEGFVYLYDGTTFSEAGGAISTEWQSIDFSAPGEYTSSYGRFIEVEAEMKGSSVDFSYSVDEGFNWSTIQTRTLTSSEWRMQKFFIDVVAKKIRIKFSSSGTNQFYAMRMLRVWARPASSR